MKKAYYYCFWTVFLALSISGCGVFSDGGGDVAFEHTIQYAKNKVFPAVVYIRVLRENKESGKDISGIVSGSGVLISANGEIVTNHHVIDKAIKIRCLLSDGRHFDAELIGSDKDIDLALIKLKTTNVSKNRQKPASSGFPFAVFAQQSPVEGDFVMAMGAPWGLSRSVTIGIISSSNRYLEKTGNYSLWYQTDAAIFPGNSGGPLVNTKGEIIGINTLGVVSGGMGFSVPAETVRILLPRFREYKQANWAWVGLELQCLQDFNRNIYFAGDSGVIIAGVEPNSPAMAAGIQPRDRLMKINGLPVTALTEENLPRINRILGLLPFGKTAVLTIERDGKIQDIKVLLEAKGKVEGDSLALPKWGITVKSINRFGTPDLYYYRHEGVYVLGADKGNTVVSNDGLHMGDIIVELGGMEIKTLTDIKKAYDDLAEKSKKDSLVIARVLRNGMYMKAVLDFSQVNNQ